MEAVGLHVVCQRPYPETVIIVVRGIKLRPQRPDQNVGSLRKVMGQASMQRLGDVRNPLFQLAIIKAIVRAEACRLLNRDDVVPGMIGAIQTHGELLHWHPHIHVLITCGAFTPEGDFLPVSLNLGHQFDMERLLAAWQDAVFELYLAQEKIEPEVVENMRTWEHSGFSLDQSVYLPAGDQAGIERLIQYMTRCPFSLSRLVKVSDTGQIVYQAEKQACRAFPDPKGDGTQAGVKRNFQILPPLDFLAEFTQHIPAKGSHLIRPRSLLKRRLVLQQVAGHAQEGGSGSIRRAIERGRFRRGTSPL